MNSGGRLWSPLCLAQTSIFQATITLEEETGHNYWSDGKVWVRPRTGRFVSVRGQVGLCQYKDHSLEDVRESLDTLVVRATIKLSERGHCQ